MSLEYNKHADITRLYRRRLPLPGFCGGLNPPLKLPMGSDRFFFVD